MSPEIGGRPIGPDVPVFAIAEIGLNHGGSVDRAHDMVDAAAAAGASAVKIQTLVADELVASTCPAPAHVTATSLREFFATYELDLDAHRAVIARARAQRERADRNAAWLQTHAASIYSQHRGRHICIAGEELFVGDSAEDALALARAAHPEDDGRILRYIPRQKVARVYANPRRMVSV
jgi:hypothetical protein